MAQQREVPLDEIQYRQEGIIQWHVTDNHGQPMDENMIHRYIQQSPFFDDTSNNGLTFLQAEKNWQAFETVNNRKALEDQLRRQKGVEYMIVEEPQPLPGGPKVVNGVGGNGMWVIRKQERDWVPAANGRRRQEDLTTLKTYFLVGENMYHAPSVGDVIGNRLTAAANGLAKFYETAKNLASFEPERGHTYLPLSTANAKSSSAVASTNGTPNRSREGSVVPGADSQSLRSASLLPENNHGLSPPGQNYHEARLLAESFKNTLEFADDFIDENPLLGDPGHFTFTHSTQAVKKRRLDAEAELAALAAAAKAKESQFNSKVATPAGKVEKRPSPPAVMTENAVKASNKEKKAGRADKMKRKKSRHSIAPGTPVSATTSSAPNSAI